MNQGMMLGTLGASKKKAGGTGDPFWSQVALLVTLNNTLNDVSPVGRALSGQRNVAWGGVGPDGTGVMMRCGGGGTEVTYAGYGVATDLAFGTGDFTWEAFTQIGTGFLGYGAMCQLAGQNDEYNAAWGWVLGIDTATHNLAIYNTAGTKMMSSSAIPPNVVTHVAASRTGGVVRLFIAGALVGTFTDTTSYGTSGQGLMLGANSTWDWYLVGLLGPVRITKGVGRYSASFTPPTSFPVGP